MKKIYPKYVKMRKIHQTYSFSLPFTNMKKTFFVPLFIVGMLFLHQGFFFCPYIGRPSARERSSSSFVSTGYRVNDTSSYVTTCTRHQPRNVDCRARLCADSLGSVNFFNVFSYKKSTQARRIRGTSTLFSMRFPAKTALLKLENAVFHRLCSFISILFLSQKTPKQCIFNHF